jgi:glucose/arabinose dehydrogenase
MGGKARYLYTYGHRNVQGLALQPGTGLMWTVEHGPDRDDEVNVEQKGGNYGWNPVPGYNSPSR